MGSSLIPGSSGAQARLGEKPTNAALLESTLSRAIETVLRSMPVSNLTKPVVLTPGAVHEAGWMVEGILGEKLREEGVEVVVSSFKTPAVATPPETTAVDSLAAADTAGVAPPQTLQPQATQPQAPQEVPHLVLEYRITELGIEYPRVWRSNFVGRKMLERYACAAIHVRLVEDGSGALVWAGDGRAVQSDEVPVSQLSLLEGKGEDWQKGTLPAGKMGAVVEPLVVTAIVAGLVYLFYSNKE